MTGKSNFVIRQAVLGDIPAIMDIRFAVRENRLSDPSRVTPAMCADYLDKLGRGWVAEVDGDVVGFSYAELADHSIWALFVRPEFEGLGLGKVLLKEACGWLFSMGAEEITLGTAVNTRADRFYAAQGWIRGEMKNAIEVHYRLPKGRP